jgi:hypothetical protein
MRTTINLPDALLDRAKREAQREGLTLGELIEAALRGRLLRTPAEPAARPFRLVTFGAGGLLPGVSLERLKDLAEDEDIGRLDRSIDRSRASEAADGRDDAPSGR